jgi:acyl-CoA synthetase (NDP forming)
MMGNALVGFCVDKTKLLWWERSSYSIFGPKIFGMPDARLSSCVIFQRFHTFDVLDKVWFWHTKCQKCVYPSGGNQMSDAAMPDAKGTIRKVLDQVRADKRTSLTAPEGKLVCDAYGIPVPKEGVARSAAEAAKIASDMGFPVVMKIVSPDILHKTEAGGVIVGVKTADDAQKAYDTILGNAKKYKADAKIEGIQVQQMLTGGLEVIVGSITDGSFGKLVAFGLGGVLVEVLKDVTSAWHLPARTTPCRCWTASRRMKC